MVRRYAAQNRFWCQSHALKLQQLKEKKSQVRLSILQHAHDDKLRAELGRHTWGKPVHAWFEGRVWHCGASDEATTDLAVADTIRTTEQNMSDKMVLARAHLQPYRNMFLRRE
jgi:hypothetical protein